MTRNRLAVMFWIVAVLLGSAVSFAHHSLAEFDTGKRITLRGTVTMMEWVNPHCWLHLDVKGPDGIVVNWAVEGGGPNSLIRRGLTKNALAVGTEVVVEAYPSHLNPGSVAHGISVLTADGKGLYLGASSDDAREK